MLAFISYVGFAQQEVVQDFENSPAVAGFEGLASASIVADPSTAGNGQVLELVTSAAGNPWQGAEVILADDSAMDLTSDITMSVDVWSTVAFSPMAKVETTGAATAATFAANTQSHTGSGWETLTYTFNTGDDGTGTANGVYNKLVFFPNRTSDGQGWGTPADGTFYFDNVTAVKGTVGGGGTTANPPTSLAPTPPNRPAGSTVSVYGDAYGAAAGLNNVPWDDPSTLTEENHAGGDVLKAEFLNGNFFGSSLGTQSDASLMTHFHMDVWISDDFAAGQVLNFKLSNHNPGGAGGETNAYEYTYPVGPNDAQTWVSIDVPVTDWTNVATQAGFADLAYVTEFLITSAGTVGVMYMDNFYFHQNTLGVNSFDPSSMSAYPNPTKDSWNINLNNSNIQTVEIFNTLGKSVKVITVNDSSVAVDASDLATGIYFAKVQNENNQFNTIKLVKN